MGNDSKDRTTREEPQRDGRRDAAPDRERETAPVRDDEHDGGFGDGPLL